MLWFNLCYFCVLLSVEFLSPGFFLKEVARFVLGNENSVRSGVIHKTVPHGSLPRNAMPPAHASRNVAHPTRPPGVPYHTEVTEGSGSARRIPRICEDTVHPAVASGTPARYANPECGGHLPQSSEEDTHWIA